jgi:hypothetical protein
VQEAVVRSRDAVVAGSRSVLLTLNRRRPTDAWLTVGATGIRSRKKTLFGSGIARCTIYGEEARVPPLAGLILVSGVYDIIKQFRYETKLGIEECKPRSKI